MIASGVAAISSAGKRVDRRETGLLIAVPKEEGEHTLKPGERRGPPMNQCGENDFRIGPCAELVRLGQLRTELLMVINFAVVDEREAAIGRLQRERMGLRRDERQTRLD